MPVTQKNASAPGEEHQPGALAAYTVLDSEGRRQIVHGGRPLHATDRRWRDLLAAGTPEEVAELIAAGSGRGRSSLVTQSQPEVARLPAAERAVVHAPMVIEEGDTRVFTAFFTEPPSFDVWRLVIRAGPSGATSVISSAHDLLDPAQQVDAALEALRIADPMARRAHVRELGELGDTRAVAAILPSLRQATAEERRVAAKALGQLGGLDAVTALVTRLDVESDRQTIGAITDALRQIPGPEADAALKSLEAHSSQIVRQFALAASLTRP